MQKFSQLKQKVNESMNSLKSIDTFEQYIAFGKDVMHSYLKESYNDSKTEAYLKHLYEHKHNCNITACLEDLNESIMPESDYRRKGVQKLNTLLETLKANPDTPGIGRQLFECIHQYPKYVLPKFIDNVKALLEAVDPMEKFKSGIPEAELDSLPLSYYDPTTVEDMTSALTALSKVMKEAVVEAEPGSWKERILPDGYGGFSTDFIKVVNNGVAEGQELIQDIENVVNNTVGLDKEDTESKKATLTWYKAFINGDFERYTFTPKMLIDNGVDVDYFIKLGLDHLIEFVNKYPEHIARNFRQDKIRMLNHNYKKFLKMSGIREPLFYAAGDEQDSVVPIPQLESWEKMYQLIEVVNALTEYQNIYKRKMVHSFTNIVKPMIDSVRLDLEILRSRAIAANSDNA